MPVGSYDAYYPSSSYSYAHGDSWRPPELDSPYERSTHVPGRRRSPSPSRRYRPYAPYFSGENNYRPTYRSDEEHPYYNRTPSPGPSRRESDPTTWSPWNNSRNSGWSDVDRIPTSPAGSGRFHNDTVTTRMHPSASWRLNRNERPARADLSSDYSNEYQPHDPSYRQSYAPDPYRPEESYATRSQYRRYSSPDSSPDPYVRSGHSTVPHSPSVGSYRRDYTPASPSVGAPYRAGYTPTSTVGGDRFVSSQTREPARLEYASYRPGWSPTSPDTARRRESLLSSTGRHMVNGQSPTRSSTPPSQQKGPLIRVVRRRPPPRSRSPQSPARSRRLYSRSPDQSIESSRSNSLSRRRYNRSRSWSRSSSKSNDDLSGTRGRSPQRHRTSGTQITSGKAVWNRPGSDIQWSAKKSALNGLKTRSPSRSSIASSRPSERAPSVPAQKSILPVWNTPIADGIGPADDQNGEDSKTMSIDEPSIQPPTKSEAIVTTAEVTMSGVQGEATTPNPLVEAPLQRDGSQVPDLPSFDLSRVMDVDEPATQPSDRPYTEHISQVFTSEQQSKLTDVESNQRDQTRSSSDRKGEGAPYSIHTPSASSDRVIDEPIPDRSEAKSRAELLSIVVRARLLCDRQTRQEIVNPIIISNQIIAAGTRVDSKTSSTPDDLVKEISDRYNRGDGPNNIANVKASLVERFNERESFLREKTRRLKTEYLALHDKWLAHCSVLDEQNRTPIADSELALPTTRSSRRNAVLGDAVRSDLEMEQIIASLGIDEATDPNHLSLRNLAKIPDMISVTHGRVDYYYDDTNHLVLDPDEYYGPHTGIHDWTEGEKEIFNAKFAAHPKQFGAIAEHLPNKTASQCVDYYYLHKKKLIDFRKIVARYGPNKRKRRGMGKNKRNALLADIRQHDAEVSRDSAASPAGRMGRGKRTPVLPPDSKDKEGSKELRRTVSRRRFPQVEGNASLGSETPTPEPEIKSRRGRRPITVVNPIPIPTPVLAPAPAPAPIAGPSNTEEAEDLSTDMERPAKRAKRIRRIKSAAIVEEGDSPEPEQPDSTIKTTDSETVQWPYSEKLDLISLLSKHGDDFDRISTSMPNKTALQISDFYKANVDRLGLDMLLAKAPKRPSTPVEDESKATAAAVRATSSPALRLAPDSIHQQALSGPRPTSSTPKDNHQEGSKPSQLTQPSSSTNGYPKEQGILPATAQYSYYDHLRPTSMYHHPVYAQHRSALGPHLPSAVHAMPYMHAAHGMPTYPAHAYHPHYAQYSDLPYTSYNPGRYGQPQVIETSGGRRLTPIRPRESPYPYLASGHPAQTSYYSVGKSNHAP